MNNEKRYCSECKTNRDGPCSYAGCPLRARNTKKAVTFKVDMAVEYEVDERRPHLRTLTIRAFNGAMFLKIAPHAVLFLPHIEHIEKFLVDNFRDICDTSMLPYYEEINTGTNEPNYPTHNEAGQTPEQ